MNELIHGAFAVLGYFAAVATIVVLLRSVFHIPNELFRKTLHFVLMFSYIPFVFGFETWWIAVLFTIVLDLILTLNLMVLERIPAYSSFLTERKKGELKRSNFLTFAVLALCMTICWGLMDDQYLVLACLYAWGIGDAFAALVGKTFGKHKIRTRFTDGKKSFEGSAAMFVASTAAVVLVLVLRGGMHLNGCILVAVIGAAVTTLVELVSPDGTDTVTCPVAAMAVILPTVQLLGGIV